MCCAGHEGCRGTSAPRSCDSQAIRGGCALAVPRQRQKTLDQRGPASKHAPDRFSGFARAQVRQAPSSSTKSIIRSSPLNRSPNISPPECTNRRPGRRPEALLWRKTDAVRPYPPYPSNSRSSYWMGRSAISASGGRPAYDKRIKSIRSGVMVGGNIPPTTAKLARSSGSKAGRSM